jgi:2-polyprenyl-3-methyl-5-hydroxy-6-metoxy-1,4-benzoquinol methylase
LYPEWHFTTLDLYDVQGGEVDIVADLCGDLCGGVVEKSSDLIICQATLEHVYNPFKAVQNMVSLLKPKGIIAVHTHTPPFPYHAFPRDDFRFSLDWFEDLESHMKGIELLELSATRGHVFAALRKNLADPKQG